MINLHEVDKITALVEVGAFIPMIANLVQLFKDKAVKGYSVWSTPCWVLYSGWFLVLYSFTGLAYAFWAEAAIVLLMGVYCGMSFYYKYHKAAK